MAMSTVHMASIMPSGASLPSLSRMAQPVNCGVQSPGLYFQHFGRPRQEGVETGPPAKASHPAGRTPHRPIEGGRLGHIAEGLHEVCPHLVRHRIIGLLALRTQRACQPLRHHPDERRLQQIRRHPQIQQSRDGAGGIVGMQRGDHQMTRQRRLHRHLGRFQIPPGEHASFHGGSLTPQ